MYCPLGYDDTQVGGCETQAALVATMQSLMMGCIAMCCLAWTYKRCKRPKKGKAVIKFDRDSTFAFDAKKKDLEEDGSHDAPQLTKEEVHAQEAQRKKMMQAAKGGKGKTTWSVVKDK
jgi:hypothetical protein